MLLASDSPLPTINHSMISILCAVNTIVKVYMKPGLIYITGKEYQLCIPRMLAEKYLLKQ